jgi:hypothetical protein
VLQQLTLTAYSVRHCPLLRHASVVRTCTRRTNILNCNLNWSVSKECRQEEKLIQWSVFWSEILSAICSKLDFQCPVVEKERLALPATCTARPQSGNQPAPFYFFLVVFERRPARVVRIKSTCCARQRSKFFLVHKHLQHRESVEGAWRSRSMPSKLWC